MVVRPGADVHQHGRRAGRAEAEGHLLLGQVDLVRRQAVVHDAGVPAGSRHRFGREVVLDQGSRLEETPDVWEKNQKKKRGVCSVRGGESLTAHVAEAAAANRCTAAQRVAVADSFRH